MDKGSPKIIKCRLIPEGWCVNIFGSLWVRRTDWVNKYLINHERIHTAQEKEMLFVFFYLWYFVEWLFRLIQYRKFRDAYMNISFEREAYAEGHNLKYLSGRKPYAWVHRLNCKTC